MTILVVEDDASVRMLIRRILEQNGYEIVEAPTATEAQRWLASLRPDLILTDVEMPGLRGDQWIQQLNQHPRYAAIPKIVLTVHDETEWIERLLALGVRDYIVKPFTPAELVKRVRTILRS